MTTVELGMPAEGPIADAITASVATQGEKQTALKAKDIPPVEVRGDVDDADILVVGWGSTWGAISGAVDRARALGHKVAQTHIVHLNPFPANLGEVLTKYPRVLVPEMNMGQLSRLLRAEFLVDTRSVTKVRGVPFTAGELEQAILDHLGGLL